MITFNNTKTIFDLVKNVGKEYENRVFIRYEKVDAIFEKGYGTFTVDTMAIAAYTEEENENFKGELHAALLGNCSYEYLTVLLGVPSGGGYLSEALTDSLENLGIITGQGYGMSECSLKISAPDYERKDKMASVGRLVTGCQVRIVDNEIQVKSPSVMMGYYNDEELTRESITEDGWLCTGDLGYLDDEGFLYLTGCKKNLIILSNGENISPEMIENCFDEYRLIADIIVYGKGEIIAAEIYPNYEYGIGLIGRILEDGTLDFLNQTGRTVLTDGIFGRHYYDLAMLEQIIREKTGKEKVFCYMAYDKNINQMSLGAEIEGGTDLDVTALIEEVKEKIVV